MRRLDRKILMVCLFAWLVLFPIQAQAKPGTYAKQPVSLTKSMIRQAGADQCSKLMIVAHPDDETLWGGAHLLKKGFFVICLTNGDSKVRKAEFESLLRTSGNRGMILSYPDRVVGGEKSDWHECKGAIRADLKRLVRYKNWKQIVTHNPEGEYGHIHHKMTNRMVTGQCRAAKKTKKLYYFGRYYSTRRLKKNEKRLTRLSKAQCANKGKLLKCFPSQRNVVQLLSHMNPFENWIRAEEWK